VALTFEMALVMVAHGGVESVELWSGTSETAVSRTSDPDPERLPDPSLSFGFLDAVERQIHRGQDSCQMPP
jgi:hypothetical protein